MCLKNNFCNGIRKGGWLLSFFFIIAVTFMPSVSEALSYEAIIQDVKKKLGVSDRIADAFLQYVNDFVSDIQGNFTKIASHKTPRDTKESLIERTLEGYFEDPMKSEVQVSSLRRTKVNSYPVQVYLNKLSKLDLYYKTVRLYFDKSYFSMGPIESYRYEDHYSRGSSTGGMGYEFKIEMWQMFEGCKRDNRNICYRDFTKKGFHIVFMPSRKGWLMRVFAITADKPVQSYYGDKPDDWRKRFQD